MQLTADILRERKTFLETDRAKMVRDLDAIDGALQQVQWTIEQLEAEEPEAELVEEPEE